MPVTDILPLFSADTEGLIENFRFVVCQSNGLSSTKSKLPLSPIAGVWSPIKPNTILWVLCYQAATKFLKIFYSLPKKP